MYYNQLVFLFSSGSYSDTRFFDQNLNCTQTSINSATIQQAHRQGGGGGGGGSRRFARTPPLASK